MNRFRWLSLPLMLVAAGAQAAAAGAAAPVALSAATSPAAGRSPSAGSLLQVLLGLIVVLALMAAAAWLVKRFGMARTAANSVVRIVGGVSVGNRERVLVLEVADQWIVVGVATGRVSALASMPRQEHSAGATSSAPAAASTANFAGWLKQTIDKRNGNQ
ncbi:MAG: flagellar biosynthetic protein FliO [Gallionellales bacterium RBG_16_56_9]|nr:MAG: flagellar biosynthetic protein FliO [Gallionellales bacterium RBG_16_56_9]